MRTTTLAALTAAAMAVTAAATTRTVSAEEAATTTAAPPPTNPNPTTTTEAATTTAAPPPTNPNPTTTTEAATTATSPVPEQGSRAPVPRFPVGWRRLEATWVAGSGERADLGADGSAPAIAFPVLGPVSFVDGWGQPRGGHGERRHEGIDIMGVAGQPLRAAFDGVVTRHQLDDRGISGVVITITRGDGLRANYFHLNDDNPGAGDGAAPASWRIPTAVQLGTSVQAGQIIGFMGDTGNAVVCAAYALRAAPL